MSRHRTQYGDEIPDFGGPTFGDWALTAVGTAFTGWAANRVYRKHKLAKQRRRQWEEDYYSDVVRDYEADYYLRDGYGDY